MPRGVSSVRPCPILISWFACRRTRLGTAHIDSHELCCAPSQSSLMSVACGRSCDKNEDYAANYLLEHGGQED